MDSKNPLCQLAATVRAKHARRKEARPGELLAAALDLFVEKGFAATRVDDVAQRAGVSKGTLFLYFPSKDELFKAVVRENLSGHFADWKEELLHYEGSSEELLRYCLNTWWERIGSTKASGIPKLVMSEAGNFPELAAFFQAEVIAPGDDLVRRILQRGVDRGEFRPVNMQYGVYSVLSHFIFMAMWKHSMGPCCDSRGELDPQQYLNTQADILINGLINRDPPTLEPVPASAGIAAPRVPPAGSDSPHANPNL